MVLKEVPSLVRPPRPAPWGGSDAEGDLAESAAFTRTGRDVRVRSPTTAPATQGNDSFNAFLIARKIGEWLAANVRRARSRRAELNTNVP